MPKQPLRITLLLLSVLLSSTMAEPITLENEHLKAVVNPETGGRVISLESKANKIEYTIDSRELGAGSGLLNDRFWGQRQTRGIERLPYTVVSQSKQQVTLRLLRMINSSHAFMIEKTIRLPEGRAELVADYRISNVGNGNWEGRFWIANVLRPDTAADEAVTYHYPTGLLSANRGREGARLSRTTVDYLPGKERVGNTWILDPRAAWMATTRADGKGVALTTDGSYLESFYSHQPQTIVGGEKVATSEVFFGPLLLRPTADDDIRQQLGIPPLVGQKDPGKPFETTVRILPFDSVGDRIVDVHGDTVVGITKSDKQLTLSAYALSKQNYKADVTLAGLPDRRAIQSWQASLSASPGKTVSQQLSFTAPPPPSQVLTFRQSSRVVSLPAFADSDDVIGYDEPFAYTPRTDFQPAVDFPEIDQGPETAHETWATPLSQKPRVLLFLVDRSRRDVTELKQRMDCEVTPVVIAHPHYFTYHSSPVGTDPYRVLEHELKADYDVIVLGGGIHWGIIPEDARTAIIEKVKAGTGLLYITPGAGDRLFSEHKVSGPPVDELFAGEPIKEAAPALLRSIPLAHIPIFRDWNAARPPISVTQLGKGTVIQYDIPIWPYGKPYMVRQTLRPFVNKQQQADIAFRHIEYHWLLTTRLISFAAGTQLPINIAIDLKDDLKTNLHIAGPASNLTVQANWIDRTGSPLGEKRIGITLPEDGSFMLAPDDASPLPGTVGVHVIVRDESGFIVGSGAAMTERNTLPRITSVDTFKPRYMAGDIVSGSVQFEGALPESAKLNLSFYDMHDRLVATQQVLAAQIETDPATKIQPDANLLPNGSFELDSTVENKLPIGWAYATPRSAQGVSIVEGNRPEGSSKHVLKLQQAEGESHALIRSPKIPIDPQRPLTVAGWVKASGESINGPGVYLGVNWYDENHRPIPVKQGSNHNYTYVISAYRKADWLNRQTTYQPITEPADAFKQGSIPPSASFIEVQVFTLEYSGQVLVDDLIVKQPAPVKEVHVEPVTPTPQLAFGVRPLTGLTTLHRIKAELVSDDDRLIDRANAEYTVEQPAPQDVTFQVWGPNNSPGTVAGELELNVIRQTGFDYANVRASAAPPEDVRDMSIRVMRHGIHAMPMSLARLGVHGLQPGDTVRKPCLTDPAFRDSTASRLKQYTDELHPLACPAYYNGDENSLGYYSVDHNLCQSPSCLARYQLHVKQRYSKLSDLNRAWGTQFTNWDDVRPPTISQAREEGRWGAWIMHRAYMPSVLADFYAFLHKTVRHGRPTAALGTSGMGRPSINNGFDWPQLLPHIDHASLYARQHSHLYRMELFRTYRNEGSLLGTWTGYGAPIPFVRESLWWELLNDMHCPGYYSSLEYLCTPAMGMTDDAKETAKDIAELKAGIGKLLMGAERTTSPIVMHHSYLAAVANESIIRRDGAGFSFDDYYFALDGYVHAIKELGQQLRMMDRTDVEKGKLDNQHTKVFIAPLAHAISDAELTAMRNFVEAGGTLICDPMFGYLNDQGLPATDRDMSSWLGIAEQDQTNSWVNNRRPTTITHGKGKVCIVYQPMWNFPRLRVDGQERLLRDQLGQLFAQADASPRFAPIAGGRIGNAIFNGEIITKTIGESQLLILRRNFQAHPAVDLPSASLTIPFGSTSEVYDARAGKHLGRMDQWAGELQPGDIKVLLLSPTKLPDFDAQLIASNVVPGQAVSIHVSQATPDRHAFALQVHGPHGERAELAFNDWLTDGQAVFTIPHALNDEKGDWQATVRNVATGQVKQLSWQVR